MYNIKHGFIIFVLQEIKNNVYSGDSEPASLDNINVNYFINEIRK